MTLMKLRLILGDLGYRFGVHQTTISRYFNNVLGIMFSRLEKLVKVPGRVIMNYKFKCNLEC